MQDKRIRQQTFFKSIQQPLGIGVGAGVECLPTETEDSGLIPHSYNRSYSAPPVEGPGSATQLCDKEMIGWRRRVLI